MKRKHLLFALLLALGLPWAANAQTLADYTFSTGTDASKWVTVTSTESFLVSGGDSQASSVLNIGFNFPFGENTYEKFSVNTDGNLKLGNTATSSSYYSTPFSSSYANQNNPKINAFGCDGYFTADHYVKYQLESDKLVVEFCAGTYNSTTRNYLYKWQVHLYTNGDIEIVFPDTDELPETAPNVTHQCGLCMNSADGWIITSTDNVATHFIEGSSTTNATGTWFDANRYYRFECPVITCPRPTLGEAQYISEEGASFQWTENGGATSWVLEYSTNQNFTNAISINRSGIPSYAITGLTAGTTYYVHVKSDCGGGDTSDWSDVVSFTTLCEAINAEGFSENFDDYEVTSAYTAPSARVLPDCWRAINTTTYSSYSVFPTIYYYSSTNYANSTPNSLKFYSYYSSTYSSYDPQPQYAILPPMNGLAGMQVTLKARGYNATSTFKIGTMSDPADASTFTMIAEQTGLTTSYQEFEYVVPANCHDNCLAIMIDAASSSRASNGVYIDDIVIATAPTCIKPNGLEVTATTTTSATLSWTNGAEGQTAWQICLNGNETNLIDANSNPFIVEGLEASSTYTAKVRANCGNGDYSDWSNTVTIETQCDVITVTDSWSENFNSLTAGIPNCWDNSEGTTTNASYKWNYYATGHDGAGLRFNSYNNSSGNTNFLKTPTLNFATGKVMQLSFWYKNPTGGDFSVYISTDGGTTYTTELATGLTSVSSWTQQEITLTNYVDAENVVIVFKGTSNWGNGDAYIYLDDVAVAEAPSCIKPTELAVTANSITNDGATITWTENGTATVWTIEYANNPSFANVEYASAEEEPTYTFNNLNDATTYYVRVRSECGIGFGESEYSSVVSFTTLQNAANLPYSNDFESENGWLFVNGDLTNAWAYGEATSNGGTHALYISNDGGTSNAYSINSDAMVYATKLFNFEAGTYVFSYDWKAHGENYSDYLRVALVPSSVQLAAATSVPSGFSYNGLPTGWIALDGGAKLNQQSEWQSFVSEDMEVAAGTYMMVFAWRNDGSVGVTPPAAIDNVSIERITCIMPTGLAVTEGGVTATTATLTWEGTSESYNVSYAMVTENTILSANFEDNTIPANFTNDAPHPWTVTAGGANGSSYCAASGNAGEDTSESDLALAVTGPCIVSFMAKVSSESGYDYGSFLIDNSEKFETSGNQAWKAYSYELTAGTHTLIWRYHKDSSNASGDDLFYVDDITITETSVGEWQTVEATEVPFTLDNLTPETTYQVKLQGNCGDEGLSTETEIITFKTASECPTPDGLAATVTTNSATISWNGYGLEEFNLRYGTDGETWETVSGVSNPYTLQSLDPATTYSVQVQPTCADEETWSAEYSFTTECEAQTITATEPFTEGFEEITGTHVYSETNGIYPTCWDSYSEGTVYPHITNSGSYYYVHEGSGTLYFKGEANTNSYLALPLFTNDLSTLIVSFWMQTESATSGTLSLGYITDADVNYNSYQVIKTYDNTTTMKQCQTYLGSNTFPSNATRLVFRWQYTGSSWYGACIDDVTVEIAPSYTLTIEGVGDDNWAEGNGGYYLIASPLADAVAPTAVDGMITADEGDVLTYDLYSFDQEQDLEWQNYRASAFNLVNGQGYLYASKNGTTLTFTGAPSTNGQVTLDLKGTGNWAGWNLVGNPFGQTAYLSRAFYSMQNAGDFTANTEGGSIGMLEGVFVIANEDEETLTFTTTAPGKVSQLNLNLTKGNNLMDRAIVRFDEGQQLPKLQFREGSTKVYIPQEGKDYAVVSSESMGTMPINFKAENNGTYTLSFTTEEVSFAYLHLIDNMTGTEVDLLANPSYTFDASTTDYESRFKLVFATGNNSNDDNFAFFSNGNFIINNEGEATLQVVDVMSRIIKSENINGCASVNVNAAPGVYMIRLINGNDVKVQKVVVR